MPELTMAGVEDAAHFGGERVGGERFLDEGEAVGKDAALAVM